MTARNALSARRAIVHGLFLLLISFVVEAALARSPELDEAIGKFDRLRELGDLERASRWGERAVALAEKELGLNDPRWVGALTHELGLVYAELGQYAQAQPLLQQALSVTKDVRGPQHVDLILIYYNLAILDIKQGRIADAESDLVEALRLSELLLVPGDPDISRYGELLAAIYEEQGRAAEAASILERIRNSTADDRDDSVDPWLLAKRASIYEEQGRYGEVEPVLRRALAALEGDSATSPLDVGNLQHRLAGVLIRIGKYRDAEDLLGRAIESRERALGPNDAGLIPMLERLAASYGQRGRSRASEAIYERALAIREKVSGPHDEALVNTLNSLAAVKSGRQRLDEARKLYLRAWEIAKKNNRMDGRGAAESLRGLASVYATIAQSWDAAGNYDAAEELNARAEKLFIGSLEILTNLLGPDPVDPLLSGILNDLGWFYFNEGRTDEGEPLAQRSLRMKERMYGSSHPFVAHAYGNLAAVYLYQARYEEALAHSRKAVLVMGRRISGIGDGQSDDTLKELQSYSQVFHTHISVLIAIAARDPLDPQAIADEAFRASQMAVASGTQIALAQMATRLEAGSDRGLADRIRLRQDMLRKYQQVDSRLIDYYGRPATERDANMEAALRIERDELIRQLDHIDESLAHDFPEYANLTSLHPVSLAEAQKTLRRDEALLLYQLSSDGIQLWVVRPDRFRLHRVRTGPTETADAVARIRSSLEVARGATVKDLKPFDVRTSHDLYRKLVAPANEWFDCSISVRIGTPCTENLLDGVRHLLIVADGALQSLPFSLLVVEEPSEEIKLYHEVQWLVKRYATTTLPAVSSLRALRRQAGPSEASNPFVGFGDPSLGRRAVFTAPSSANRAGAHVESLRNLTPLPGSAVELFAIANALSAQPAKNVFLRRDATETALKAMSRAGSLKNYRVVAFATHGLVAGQLDASLEPGLVLTPPAQYSEGDDGYLSASEVGLLRLDADWVILSACDTASPDGTPGAEGLSGLAKAFLYAGSRALLVSHWRVSSDATVALTTELFRISANTGVEKSEALRRSMLKLMEDKDNPHFAHPLFWAPFVVVGEGG